MSDITMSFGIKRLAADGNGRRYHLYNNEGQLQLVADHGSPWLPKDPYRQVRIARPDGTPIASLDLPWQSKTENQNQSASISYAIIFDHAVAAIITEYGKSLEGEQLPIPYFVLEVEGSGWLACGDCDIEPFFALYDVVPAGLSVYTEPIMDDLPPPVGTMRRDDALYDYSITLSITRGKLRQRALLSLALVFLIDRFVCTK